MEFNGNIENRTYKWFNQLLLGLVFTSITLMGYAQHKNFVMIDKSMSEKELVKIAANIVPSPQQLRWQRLELTGFIHFGINTFTGNEWGDGKEDPKLFNPTELDARQWVKSCKEAGIKQVILTAKHHDGFCLWPTKFTEHSVKNSSWKEGKGDVVKEVADACKEMEVGFGVYLSPWDMNNVSYGTDAYNDFFINQLTELLTQYGQIDEVWFDGANGEGPNGKKQVYDFERWFAHIRKLQPQAVIAVSGPDVRWVGTETGHGREEEWSVVPMGKNNITTEGSQTKVDQAPAGDMRGQVLGSRAQLKEGDALKWYPAETDVSIRPGWFYHESEDKKVKTPEYLKEIYFNSVGRNGVLLLNIPPDKRGLITDYDTTSLKVWREKLNHIFAENLLKEAKAVGAVKKNKNLLDGNDSTYYFLPIKKNKNIVEIDLKEEKTFNVLLLQENITVGQRVEKFVFEYWKNGEWKKATEGTTIGFKRLLEFPSVSASKVRLRILSSRLKPALSEIGLYFDK
ncbi:alpha-L-fucosidase [Flavobacterium sp.]|uniref:alpha-L-fucosidase n=1 Tax=Flavobacterium sp. TaxID=239 RepID=UPI0025BF932F|nr:alpha-L-fucosidase [Flavobacterium sp.]MBA4275672.1 alpha-L-fucosidase [Flavobacterium sp.]